MVKLKFDALSSSCAQISSRLVLHSYLFVERNNKIHTFCWWKYEKLLRNFQPQKLLKYFFVAKNFFSCHENYSDVA